MRRFWLISLCSAAGLLIGIGVAFWRTPEFTSHATLVLRPSPVPEQLFPQVVTLDLDSVLRNQAQVVLSRARLKMMIESLDLYPDMKARLPTEDVVQHFRTQIRLTQERPNLVHISFTAEDRFKAQKVVSEIASGLIAESIREHSFAIRGTTEFLKDRYEETQQQWLTLERKAKEGKADQKLLFDRDFARKRYEDILKKLDAVQMASQLAERRMTPMLDVVDPASIPERADSGRAPVIALGALIGLMSGLVGQLVYEQRGRRLPRPVAVS